MGFLAELIGTLVSWFSDLLAPFAERLVQKQAERALAQGRVECSLRLVSGSQRGLSSRWRSGVATVSPGRLDFTGRWRSPRATGR